MDITLFLWRLHQNFISSNQFDIRSALYGGMRDLCARSESGAVANAGMMEDAPGIRARKGQREGNARHSVIKIPIVAAKRMTPPAAAKKFKGNFHNIAT